VGAVGLREKVVNLEKCGGWERAYDPEHHRSVLIVFDAKRQNCGVWYGLPEPTEEFAENCEKAQSFAELLKATGIKPEIKMAALFCACELLRRHIVDLASNGLLVMQEAQLQG
jgi:hypothetical protein